MFMCCVVFSALEMKAEEKAAAERKKREEEDAKLARQLASGQSVTAFMLPPVFHVCLVCPCLVCAVGVPAGGDGPAGEAAVAMSDEEYARMLYAEEQKGKLLNSFSLSSFILQLPTLPLVALAQVLVPAHRPPSPSPPPAPVHRTAKRTERRANHRTAAARSSQLHNHR